jgi:ribosomal protein L40E
MEQCPACGALLPLGDLPSVCPSCGAALSGPPAEAPTSEPGAGTPSPAPFPVGGEPAAPPQAGEAMPAGPASTPVCRHCGAENPPAATSCLKCGNALSSPGPRGFEPPGAEPLPAVPPASAPGPVTAGAAPFEGIPVAPASSFVCRHCGVENPPDAAWCRECGNALAPPVSEAAPQPGAPPPPMGPYAPPAAVPEGAAPPPSAAPGAYGAGAVAAGPPKVCTQCGTLNPATAFACQRCGAALAPTGAAPIGPTYAVPRPMGLGRALDTAIQVYKTNLGAIVGPFAILQSPTLLMFAVMPFIMGSMFPWMSDAMRAGPFGPATEPPPVNPDDMFASMGVFLLVYGIMLALGVVQLILSGWILGAISIGGIQGHLGRRISMREAFAQARPFMWSLLGIILLTGVAMWAASMVAMCCLYGVMLGAMAGASASSGGAGAAVFLGAFILAYAAMLGLIVAVGVWFGLAPVACIVERAGAIGGISRSFQLVRPHFWRLFGWTLVLGLFVGILVYGPQVLSMGLFMALPSPAVQSIVGTFASIAGTFVQPIALIAFVVFYFDQRARVEGLDVLSSYRAARQPQG